MQPLTRLKLWVGLDRAIAYTVTARFWAGMAGIVTLLLIARFLTPSEQGYYYTFYSLVALQVVFELGFSFVVLQLAAHERAQLTFLPRGRIEGDAVAHSRLASVLQKSIRWYSVAGVLMAAVLVPAGMYFFKSHQVAGVQIAWKTPWFLLVFATMLAFQIDPVFSFLEGCGFVREVAHRRLVQAILGSALAWTAMMLHHGLYAPALIIFGQVVVGLAFMFSGTHKPLLRGLFTYPVRGHAVGWRSEIWPFQWRIAVSWLAGYFIYQIFSPVVFAYQGPVAAGQMGMSMSIASAVGSVGLAWMSTKASPFGALVARGEFRELDRIFFKTLWQSTVIIMLGAAALLAVYIVAAPYYPKMALRILPPWVLGLLLLNSIMNHVVCSQALYLRAHKQEPFYVQALISAVLIGVCTVVLGKYYGANAVVVGVFVQGILFGVPYATYIFVTKRKLWHRNGLPIQNKDTVYRAC
jgi:O-antigen/teichoic acid export membrane protein